KTADLPPPQTAPVAALTGGQAAISFIVHFANGHPLGRAQELEGQGRHADAVQAAHAGLRARRELRGLCFDRFTVGGAETVLRVCTPSGDRAAIARRWTERFASMDGVEYAEPNSIFQAEKRE